MNFAYIHGELKEYYSTPTFLVRNEKSSCVNRVNYVHMEVIKEEIGRKHSTRKVSFKFMSVHTKPRWYSWKEPWMQPLPLVWFACNGEDLIFYFTFSALLGFLSCFCYMSLLSCLLFFEGSDFTFSFPSGNVFTTIHTCSRQFTRVHDSSYVFTTVHTFTKREFILFYFEETYEEFVWLSYVLWINASWV